MQTIDNNHVKTCDVGESQLAEFDPACPEFRADPYPIYQRLRIQEPIHYRPSHKDWVLSREDDIRTVLHDERFGYPDTLANADASAQPICQGANSLAQLATRNGYMQDLWLVVRNPPDHTRLRKLLSPPFVPHCAAGLRPRIQEITDSLIDQVEDAGRCDVIAELAYPLSVAVISEILGIPSTMREDFKHWSRDLAKALEMGNTSLDKGRGLIAMTALVENVQKLIAARRKHPQDDLMSDLIQAQKEANPLRDDELVANWVMLFLLGHEPSYHFIGNGLLALLRHPVQLQLLQQNPTLIGTAVEELLRYDSPVQIIWRTARMDIELGGKTIQKGQRVYLLLGAANRDPAKFPQPDQLDITRRPNPHLAFGYARHRCLGAHLAQITAEIAIGTLIRRLPSLALATEELAWEGIRTRGLKALSVVF